jgi:hypothetical protein
MRRLQRQEGRKVNEKPGMADKGWIDSNMVNGERKKNASPVRTLRRTPNGPGPLRWEACLIRHRSMCRPGSVRG